MERLTVKETARMLGCMPMAVSLMLRQKLLPFGIAYKNNAGKWSYIIYKADVLKYVKNREV